MSTRSQIAPGPSPLPLAAIVVAAGHSRRMGSPKALLPLPPGFLPNEPRRTFVGHLASTFAAAGCDPILVVANPSTQAAIAQELAAISPTLVLLNPQPEAPMITSLRLALGALPASCPAFLLTPVDQPFITAAYVARLIAAHRDQPQGIIIPESGGQRGHPVVFPHGLVAEFLGPEADRGAHQVVLHHEAEVVLCPMGDLPVDSNINTPEEYARWHVR